VLYSVVLGSVVLCCVLMYRVVFVVLCCVGLVLFMSHTLIDSSRHQYFFSPFHFVILSYTTVTLHSAPPTADNEGRDGAGAGYGERGGERLRHLPGSPGAHP
jgi:hypothetical protein